MQVTLETDSHRSIWCPRYFPNFDGGQEGTLRWVSCVSSEIADHARARLSARAPNPQSHSANAAPKERVCGAADKLLAFPSDRSKTPVVVVVVAPQSQSWTGNALTANEPFFQGLCGTEKNAGRYPGTSDHNDYRRRDILQMFARMIRMSSPVNTEEDGHFSDLSPGSLSLRGLYSACSDAAQQKVGEKQRESANSIPGGLAKNSMRPDSLPHQIRWGNMETRSTISLSERRPEEEEDDDVDAMKVMNRCWERPTNPFLGLARTLPTVYSKKYIFAF